MLDRDRAVLVLIDVQVRLARAMSDEECLVADLRRMVRGAQVLGVPIVWVEQNPRGLGPTVPDLAELLEQDQPDAEPLVKMSFSCCGDEKFVAALAALERNQILLAGIETHVCVYQTAMSLLARGHEVQVVADAVSSRTADNREIGLGRMKDAGATLTSVETALFELLKVAEGDAFKQILQIVK